MNREEFSQAVREALLHLHNRPWLARSPLANALARSGQPLTGDNVRLMLLAAIDELKPVGATTSALAWRPYRLLTLRYAEGYDLPKVASTLGISVRQAARAQHVAIDLLVDVLWRQGRTETGPPGPAGSAPLTHETDDALLGELTAEAAKVATHDATRADLASTIADVVQILQNFATAQGVTIRVLLVDALPPVRVSRTIIRQALCSLLAWAVSMAAGGELFLTGRDTERGVAVRAVARWVGRRPALRAGTDAELERLAAAGQQLIETQGGFFERGDLTTGDPLFVLTLPPAPLRTALVVDDNPDVARLVRRYLRDQPFRVIHAASATSALRLAKTLHPDVIILDIIMPLRDGWDVLSALRQSVETREIPIVVCSILPHHALAMSLGANVFLAKPLTQQTLLTVLRQCVPP